MFISTRTKSSLLPPAHLFFVRASWEVVGQLRLVVLDGRLTGERRAALRAY